MTYWSTVFIISQTIRNLFTIIRLGSIINAKKLLKKKMTPMKPKLAMKIFQ